MSGLPAGAPRLLPPATAVSSHGAAAWAAMLARPDQLLVALDYDGTLAPIVDDPDRARPVPGAVDVLGRLARHVALVVVITGRPARQLVDLAGLAALTGERVLVLGAYGTESWDARTDRYTVPDPGPAVAAARDRLTRLVAAAPPGTWLEDKGRAVAVHTRRTSDPAGVQAALEPAVRAVADELGLRCEPGRAVLEIREPGGDKGDALRAAVRRCGARAVLYCGDDLGDVPAFEAAGQLRTAGVSVLRVAVTSAERDWPQGLTDAQVDGPVGVLTLLRALLPPDGA